MPMFDNPHRGGGPLIADCPMPSVDSEAVASRLSRCPAHAETPLIDATGLAKDEGVAALWLKDERGRMGLGSFKALGAAYVIARDAEAGSLEGVTYVTASAGNHGMSLAAGAEAFGATARIYLDANVPESFADRLRARGAVVVRDGSVYEESMAAAAAAAAREGWRLLSDSSWPGYVEPPHRLMEGYTALAQEAVAQVPEVPTHIFLHAGVGGMAAALAACFRSAWGDGPRIVVVEPEAAPAILEGLKAGRVVTAAGPVSAMGRLDCKEASMIALNGLARDADACMTLGEDEARQAVARLKAVGVETTPSGAAGVAGFLKSGAGPEARVLCVISEGAA